MTKFAAIGVLIIVVILGIGFIFLNKSLSPVPSVDKNNQQASAEFGNPKKSAHYESNTPEHGSTLAGVPINVVINFNFDLAKPSEITIEKDGKDWGVGETIIDENKLSMRRNMAPNAPDGIYTVNYNACWPDGSCHDGYFQFAIDRSLSSGFEDMTGQKEITIRMNDIAFVPMNVRISKRNDSNYQDLIDKHEEIVEFNNLYTRGKNFGAIIAEKGYSTMIDPCIVSAWAEQ